MIEELSELLREAIEAAHQTGMIRDHADPNRPGWIVGAIETCEDPMCVDALAALARADAYMAQMEKVITAKPQRKGHSL